jgi:hypothetical protein
MLIHIFDAEVQVLRALVTEVTGRHKWRRLDAAYLINSRADDFTVSAFAPCDHA